MGILYLLWAEIGENSEHIKRNYRKMQENWNQPGGQFFIREEEEEDKKP
ncbi:hypothetical protein [Cohnella sp. AR92]|nr:hypothetical protein [Cohnella sp. AR92]